MEYAGLVDRIDSSSATGWDVLFAAWEDQRRGADVLILSIGDPNFPTPEPIVDAAVDALRSGDTHYTDIPGRPALRELVAARFSAAAAAAVPGCTTTWTTENVVVMAGTQNALFAASLCLLETGDEVVTFDPMYLTYDATLRAGGADLVPVVQGGETGFRIEPDAIAAAVTDATKAIVLTNPNNPTGTVATLDELEGVADVARRHNLWVIADEVYADLVFEGRHIPIAALEGMADRTVTVSSLSKSHAMTGWRIGWAIGPAEFIGHADNLALSMSYGVPGFIQEAAAEALTTQDPAVSDMRTTYQRRRDLLVAELAAADNLPVLSPQGGMYVLVDVRAHAPSSLEFCWDLYRATGVAAVDAGAFGSATEGWIRIAFTISDDDLVEACRRIVEFTRARSHP